MSDGRSTPGSGISVRIWSWENQKFWNLKSTKSQKARSIVLVSYVTMMMTFSGEERGWYLNNVHENPLKGFDNNMFSLGKIWNDQKSDRREWWHLILFRERGGGWALATVKGGMGQGSRWTWNWEQKKRKSNKDYFVEKKNVLFLVHPNEQSCWYTLINYLESGACNKDAPDSVEAVLSGRETKQEGQVHQGIFIQIQII